VAKHHNQWRSQYGNTILNIAHGSEIYHVTGVAHDEHLAEAAAEQQLWRDAAVGTANEYAKRRLLLRQHGTPLLSGAVSGDDLSAAVLHGSAAAAGSG